jgi:nanoRNase/pAp phosphatase (c-di-AMP/oligoRNAs hydrolase)
MTNETKELIKSYLEDRISDNMGKELRPYILDKSYMYLDYNQKTNTLVFDKESKVKPISSDSKKNFYKYWDENFTDKLVITHKNCNDGTGTAEVIKYYNKLNYIQEPTIMYLTHDSFDFKDVVEACKDKVVYVGDFSFTKDELEELTKVTKSIIVIDHHLSAFESIGDLDYVHIDLEKSGARLAWEFFFPRADRVPILIALIEDRDLWNFFYDKEDTNALVLALKSEKDLNFKTLIEDEDAVTDLIEDYSSVLEYIENEDLKYSKKVDNFMFFRTSFVGINTNLPSSNILNLASREHGKPALSYNIEKVNNINNIKISMRNHDESVDVSRICKLLGGGGHAKAAGATFNGYHHKE